MVASRGLSPPPPSAQLASLVDGYGIRFGWRLAPSRLQACAPPARAVSTPLTEGIFPLGTSHSLRESALFDIAQSLPACSSMQLIFDCYLDSLCAANTDVPKQPAR